MSHTSDTETAADLFERAEVALAVCGLPQFDSADAESQIEELKYFGDEGTWALAAPSSTDDEYVAVDYAMAQSLIERHLSDWLLLRGYQLQVRCNADRRRWILVDCLSAADGGGDRLDVDYPSGEDHLQVLVNAVLAVNTL
jgi:hypothetical protein